MSKSGHAANPDLSRRTSTAVGPASGTGSYRTSNKIEAMLRYSQDDVHSGRFQKMLYRFLVGNIPSISAGLWTWVKLTATEGKYQVSARNEKTRVAAEQRLNELPRRIYVSAGGSRRASASMMLSDLCTCLYRDGLFGGFLTVLPDASGVDGFVPVDPMRLSFLSQKNGSAICLQQETGSVRLDRPDFYYLPLNGGLTNPLGQSMLRSIPFVGYIEQQLVDDMRKSSHNSGYHRLHVRVTPPERMAGESDQAFVERINGYFDKTVSMIRDCEVDENPVTWDNVQIDYIGPENTRSVSGSWFLTHRAMIEEICAGLNLAPFLLGYSYGATTSWSGFKFDLVMRQVHAIQRQLSDFLEWIGKVDLALAGIDADCRYVFDNTFIYQATDRMNVEKGRVDNILKLFQAGLIDEETARSKAGDLL